MERERKLKQNNNGMALVTVIIVIAMAVILSASLLTVAGASYKMRHVDQKTKDVFYKNEAVIDDAQMVVQNLASTQLASLSGDTKAYINNVYNEMANQAGGTSSSQIADYLKKQIEDIDKGVQIKELTLNNVKPVERTDKKLTLKDLKVTYTDKNGYTSTLKTDISINAPTKKTTTKPDKGGIARYSMIVGSGCTLKSGSGNMINNGKPGFFVQEGDVYIGQQVEGAASSTLALDINDGLIYELSGQQTDIDGDIEVRKGVLRFTGDEVKVNGVITLANGSHLVIDENTHLTCKDIQIKQDGKTYSLYGDSSGTVEAYEKTKPSGLMPEGGYSKFFPYTEDPANKPDDNQMSKRGYYKADNSNPNMIIGIKGNKAYELLFNKNTSILNKIDLQPTYQIGTSTLSWGNGKNITLNSEIKPDGKVCYGKSSKAEKTELLKRNGSAWTPISSSDTLVDKTFDKIVNTRVLYSFANEPDGATNNVSQPSAYMSGTATEKYIATQDLRYYSLPSDTKPDRNDNEWKEFTYKKNGITKKYQANIQFGKARDINAGQANNKFALFICNDAYKVQFNSGDHYIGIFMSTKKITYEVNEFKSVGYAILDNEDKDAMKKYFDHLGNYFIGKTDDNAICTQFGFKSSSDQNKPDWSQVGIYTMNSFFNGGTKIFYDYSDSEPTKPDDGSGSTDTDLGDNDKIDFIQMENWSNSDE